MADTKRLSRRMAGLLKTRLPDMRLESVRDPRKARGKRWPLSVILRICVVGLMARRKSLAQTESLSDEMSAGMAQMLNIPRRIPDTTETVDKYTYLSFLRAVSRNLGVEIC